MSFLDSRLYRTLDTLSDFFLLNLLWLVACLPLVTIFPATAALFAVVRGWTRGKETGIVRRYFTFMRENLVPSLILGFIWLFLGLVLVADFLFVQSITSWLRTPLLILFFMLALTWAASAVYLFPVIVHFEASWRELIKLVIVSALRSPLITLAGMVVLALAGVVIYAFPVTLLILSSVVAYLLYRLAAIGFERIEALMVDSAEGTQRD